MDAFKWNYYEIFFVVWPCLRSIWAIRDLTVKNQSLHTADYHRAVFRKSGDGWLWKHLRKFSVITKYKTDTFTDQKLYHLCNNTKLVQLASCKGDLMNLLQGKVKTVHLTDPKCPSGSQGWMHVPCPYPDAIPVWELIPQEFLLLGEEGAQRELLTCPEGAAIN